MHRCDEPPEPERAGDEVTIARKEERRVNFCARELPWLVVAAMLALGLVVMVPSASAQTTIAQTTIAQTTVAKSPRSGMSVSDGIEVSKSSAAASRPGVSLRGSEGEFQHGVVRASGARVREAGGNTLVEISLSGSVSVTAFTLGNPDRVVLDLAEIDFQLPDGAGRDAVGLVRAYRYGLLGTGRSRVVIDTIGPTRIVRAEIVRRDNAYLLVTELEPIRPDAGSQSAQIPAGALPSAARPKPGPFVVVIDPGHGGADAGAVNATTGVIEKDVVLAVARQLKAALETAGGFDVRMTRTGDTFVSLDRRVQFSEAAEANLFISIHADAVSDALLAQSARGATVYTLSEQASSDAARAVAEKENAADGEAAAMDAGANEIVQVNAILADLAKRQTQAFSNEFQHLLVERMRPDHLLARDPIRSASFKVLRQSHVPTVLVELGFVSNQGDASQMLTVDWQKRVGQIIAGSVGAFASRHGRAAN